MVHSEPNAPVSWNGNKLKAKTGDQCEWGATLPTQCFGLGPERLSPAPAKSRLSAAECAAACCVTKGCTMWQELPGRGCYYSDDAEDHYCDPVSGLLAS